MEDLKKVTIAAVQTNPKILEKNYNLEKAILFTREAHKKGAKFVVFPECNTTGYCFSSLQEAIPVSEPIPGQTTDLLHKICKELDVLVLMGLIEKAGNNYYNSAVLIGPEGIIGNYRKIHLPFLGVDRFVNGGDIPFTVYDTKFGKLGWIICYDNSFPESLRALALKGVEIAALSTNWPEGVEATAKYIFPARAVENRINYIAANRVGNERGIRFIGQSKIVDFAGNILAEASPDREEIICAEVDLEKARNKRSVFVPGEFELDRIKDRKPEFYGDITKVF